MKYVIEINNHAMNDPFTPALYRAKGFRTLVFDEVGLNKLTPLSDAIGHIIKEEREQAYRDGFENGEREGYDKAHAECVAKSTRSYNDGFDAGEEELKGIVLNFLRSMVENSENKCKPEVRIFDSCDDCIHGNKPCWANPCVDCKHSHDDFFERKA